MGKKQYQSSAKKCSKCEGPPTERDRMQNQGKLTVMYDRKNGEPLSLCSNCLLVDTGPMVRIMESRGAIGWDAF